MLTPDPLVRTPARTPVRSPVHAVGRRQRLAVWLRYCAVSAVSTGTSLTTLGVLVGVAGVDAAARTANWPRGWHTVAVETANVAAYGALWILQFFVLDRLLFAHRDSQEALSSVEAGSQGGRAECAHGNDPGPTTSRRRAAGPAATAGAGRPVADRPVAIRG